MIELFRTKNQHSFTLRVLGGLLLLICGGGLLYGQTYKLYYKNTSEDAPMRFTVKDIDINSLNSSIVIGGEYRIDSLSRESYGYTLETDMGGIELSGHALEVSTTGLDDGFRMGGIAIDDMNRSYFAGSFSTDMSNPNSSIEKSLSGLDVDGKLRWSQMEGSRHFVDVAYDRDDNSIVALGAPGGRWLFSQPLSILKLNTDGQIQTHYSIYDPTINQGVKIIDLPNKEGYLVVAIYDTAGLKSPYILRFDQQMKRVWSLVYSNFLYEYNVSDIAYHPDGQIAVTGTSYNPITDEKKAFILNVRDDGRINYSYQIDVLGQGDTEGNGISYVKHSNDTKLDGFLLAGAFQTTYGTAVRHSLVYHINMDGKITWAKDYSNFSVEDFTEDEVAKQVIFLEGTDTYVAAGEYKATIGQDLYHSQVWMAKAHVKNGYLQDSRACSAPVSLNITSDTLGIYRAGTDTSGHGLVNFGYPVSSLDFSRISCSYSQDVREDQVTSNTPLANPLGVVANKIEIFDLTGRLILKTSANNQSWKAGLTHGIYLVRYLKDQRILSSEKIVLP